MPKSKKPHKHYDPRRYAKRRMMRLKDLQEMKAAYTAVELAVELRLHTGEFTKDDILNLGSFITLATFILYRGYGLESVFCVETYGDEWIAMQKAYTSYRDRFNSTGSPVVTGDELNAIRNGVAIAGTIIQAALDKDPLRVALLFLITENCESMPTHSGKASLVWLDQQIKKYQHLRFAQEQLNKGIQNEIAHQKALA